MIPVFRSTGVAIIGQRFADLLETDLERLLSVSGSSFEPITNTRVLTSAGILVKVGFALIDLVIEVNQHDDVSMRVITQSRGPDPKSFHAAATVGCLP